MKKAIILRSTAALLVLLAVFPAQNVAAQTTPTVASAEKELQEALGRLHEQRQDQKYHGPPEELKKKPDAVKKASDKLRKALIEEEQKAAKDKKSSERQKARDKKVRDALDKWAKAAHDAADAKSKEDYDKAKEELDKAKEELDKARKDKADDEALEKAEIKASDARQKKEKKAEELEKLKKKNAQARDILSKQKELEKAEEELKKAEEELEKLKTPKDQPQAPGEQNQAPRQFYFVPAPTGAQPFGGLSPQSVRGQALQDALFEPTTLPQLLEALRGEFALGTLSAPPPASYSLSGRARFSPGLRVGLGIGERLELRAQGQRFQNEWESIFSLTIFPFEGTQPRTTTGSLRSSENGFAAEADLACFLSSGRFRPYLRAGGRGIFVAESIRWASVGGIDLPLAAPEKSASYSAFGGGGLRALFLKNGFVDLGLSYGKSPGTGCVPAVDLAAGWRF